MYWFDVLLRVKGITSLLNSASAQRLGSNLDDISVILFKRVLEVETSAQPTESFQPM